jgi:hypothetical protein
MLGRTAAGVTGAVAGLLADPPEQAAMSCRRRMPAADLAQALLRRARGLPLQTVSALIIVNIAKSLPSLCISSLIPASPSFRCVMHCIVSLCEAK